MYKVNEHSRIEIGKSELSNPLLMISVHKNIYREKRSRMAGDAGVVGVIVHDARP
jgi:hypothetical protein